MIFIVKKRDESGNVTHVLCTVRSISDSKRREEDLNFAAEAAKREAEMKTRFLATMSHDIRTPLNGIIGMVNMGNQYADDLLMQQKIREKAMESLKYLVSLVNDVLDMGKLEAGQFTLKHDPFMLSKILTEVNMVSETQAESCNVHFISKDIGEIEHDHVIGSPVYLKRIFLNFTSNAIKYNRAGGQVYVHGHEVSFDGKTALYEFVCEDTGIGMSEEFQNRAFDPFTQEERDDARTTYVGTGLGLSITKQLIDLMGGTIELESTVGVGTKITFRIPLEVDFAEHEEEKEVDYSKIMFDGVRVLLAEDNDLNAEIASFMLEHHGMKVTWVKNGKFAVDEMKQRAEDYDLIFMDVMMPIMDGLKATKKIRKMGYTIPIIAMTANAFTDDMQKSLEAGMNAHLTKPLKESSIVKTIVKSMKKPTE